MWVKSLLLYLRVPPIYFTDSGVQPFTISVPILSPSDCGLNVRESEMWWDGFVGRRKQSHVVCKTLVEHTPVHGACVPISVHALYDTISSRVLSRSVPRSLKKSTEDKPSAQILEDFQKAVSSRFLSPLGIPRVTPLLCTLLLLPCRFLREWGNRRETPLLRQSSRGLRDLPSFGWGPCRYV